MYLVDYGLSRVRAAKQDAVTMLSMTRGLRDAGTPVYLAPELILQGRNQANEHSDIWSCGITYVRLFTRNSPPWGEAIKQEDDLEKLVRSKEMPSGVKKITNNELRQLVVEMLSYEPTNRPSAKEVFKRLGRDIKGYRMEEFYKSTEVLISDEEV